MPTNVNSAVGPSIQPAGRTAETKTDRIVINKDGGSSSAFAKQTDVKFTNSVDNMSAVLDKIANSRLGTEAVLPKQLQEMINNVVRNAFSLENSLGEGLGSAMASERYSAEQLTILGRIFQQLGNQAEADAVSASQLTGVQAGGSAMAGQLTDALQLVMANIKNLIGEGALSGNTGDLELVQLNKLAFQLLNSGSAEGVPEDLARLLQQLSGQITAAGQAGIASGQVNEESGILKQLVDVLFPKPLSGSAAGNGAGSLAGNVSPGGYAGTGLPGADVSAANGNSAQGTQQSAAAGAGGQGQSANNAPVIQQNTAAGAGSQGQSANNVQGNQQTASVSAGNQGQAANNAQGTASAANQEMAKGNNDQGAWQPGRESGMQTSGGQSNANAQSRVAELENNPLFRQIFSRYGYTQETGVVKNPVQQAQQPQPQFANNQQAVAAFKDMAQLLLKDSSLTAKDAQLLQDFVNGSQEALSQQDAKQLNLLLRTVQSNIPAAIQQAGQQQGMDGLPRLWAFLQLAELGTLKNIKAKDLKTANREIKTMLSSLKGAVSSEGSYKADGQKSISFVMPLYIGENEQSYPAYINLYHEPPHEDERGRLRKDTWFRVCVLTENIGAVDIVCQLYEGNNLNLRVRFSDQEAVQAFSEYLPDIRKALYDTSVHLNDLKVGTVN